MEDSLFVTIHGQHQLNVEVNSYIKLWGAAIRLARADIERGSNEEDVESALLFLQDDDIIKIIELLEI